MTYDELEKLTPGLIYTFKVEDQGGQHIVKGMLLDWSFSLVRVLQDTGTAHVHQGYIKSVDEGTTAPPEMVVAFAHAALACQSLRAAKREKDRRREEGKDKYYRSACDSYKTAHKHAMKLGAFFQGVFSRKPTRELAEVRRCL